MSDILDTTFSALLDVAEADGADLVKWGGDAVALLFQGPDHALRAARSVFRMRATMRRIGRIPTSSGTVVLRMSVGVHSGDFDFFLVGDPLIHRELLITGPDATTTADMETAAAAGEIGLSASTASLLPPQLLGAALPGGRLLRSEPLLDDVRQHAAPVDRGRRGRRAATPDPGTRARRRRGARASGDHGGVRAVLGSRPAAAFGGARRARGRPGRGGARTSSAPARTTT